KRAARTLTTSVGLRTGTTRVEISDHAGGSVLVLGFDESGHGAGPASATGAHCRTIIAGEPGTGRTTQARRLAGAAETTWLNAVDAVGSPPQSWALQLRRTLAGT